MLQYLHEFWGGNCDVTTVCDRNLSWCLNEVGGYLCDRRLASVLVLLSHALHIGNPSLNSVLVKLWLDILLGLHLQAVRKSSKNESLCLLCIWPEQVFPGSQKKLAPNSFHRGGSPVHKPFGSQPLRMCCRSLLLIQGCWTRHPKCLIKLDTVCFSLLPLGVSMKHCFVVCCPVSQQHHPKSSWVDTVLFQIISHGNWTSRHVTFTFYPPPPPSF